MQRTSNRTLVLNDGRTLGYAEYGDPLGKPILLFHGKPGSRLEGALFDRAAQALNARILVADRPGYANSSPVRRGTLMGYVDDVAALACAAKFPELVRYCGLMSAIGPLALPHSMDGMASRNRIFFTLARFMPTLPGVVVPRQFKSSMKSLQKHLDEGTSQLTDVPPAVFALLTADQLEVVRAGGKGITFDFGILTRDLGFPLKQIHTKVPMWHGAVDNLAPLALARKVAEHIPGCVIKVIPNAGHAGTYACADEVMRTLVQ